jgi:hypothetical protein
VSDTDTPEWLRLKLALSVMCGRSRTAAIMRVKNALDVKGWDRPRYIHRLEDFTRAEVDQALVQLEPAAERTREIRRIGGEVRYVSPLHQWR